MVLIGDDKAFDSGVGWWQASAPPENRADLTESLALAKTDLGDKQLCPNCGAKFYDLRKRPAVCPKCTTSFDPTDEGTRSRRGRSRVAAAGPDYEDDEDVKAKGKADDEEEDEEAEVEETPAIDAEAEAEPLVTEDDEEDAVTPAGEELPEGFSEDDESDLVEDADDDSVPLLEDEEEFPEDEIGEIASENEDDDSSR
jgi:uncharacterized protein (TIGR02300 family)